MSSIDDPIEAVKTQYRDRPDPVMELVVDVAGSLHPFAGVVNAIRNHFSRSGAEARTLTLLNVFEDTIRRHERTLEELRDRIESPQFLTALTDAVTESIRTASQEQIARFGTILGNAAVEAEDPSETAAFIRDLARLTELDITALRILYRVQKDVVSAGPVPTDPNPYTERITGVLEAVDAANISRDDFYARCSRLTGFGLALEVSRNTMRQKPGDHCYRITARGHRLLQLMSLTETA